MTLEIAFDNSYAALPARFYARLAPEPVAAPELVRLNAALAQELGLDPLALRAPEGVAMLAGNALPDGAAPLAQAYAGHQFGGFVPQLGDGRALLLGEVIDAWGQRRDIQLKGSGRTPFSRQGDGRAGLGPVLREYVVSEAMHALRVPTTRALAAVTTGDWVYREIRVPGAVLTRVATSHIRVGTFQYFAVRGDQDALCQLFEHARARHFPGAPDALAFLHAAVAAQARLIAQWMGLGFIHGVMNTDNCHVAGETIDYGPCAFMEGYHPQTVFSSIDQHGRYAYANQPQIAVWNLAQLASCLLPLIDSDEDTAVEAATEAVHSFPALYQRAWLERFGAKLGLAEPKPDDRELIEGLLEIMARQDADFTRSFRGLVGGGARTEFTEPEAFDRWVCDWQARLEQDSQSAHSPETIDRLRANNPAFIPRNHLVAQAIDAATGGDFTPFHRLCDVLARPYDDQPGAEDLQVSPRPGEVVTQTFCGT